MFRVNMREAKSRFCELVRTVETKKVVIVLCRHGKPVAELKARARRRSRLTPDPILSQVVILYDPTEPLTEAEWASQGR